MRFSFVVIALIAAACGGSVTDFEDTMRLSTSSSTIPDILTCQQFERMQAEIIAEGGGFASTEEAARDHLAREISEGGELVPLSPNPTGWVLGVEKNGDLVARVRVVQLADGTWLVSASERCAS